MFTKVSFTLLALTLSQLFAAVIGNVHASNITSRAPSTFKHPGVLIDREQLDFVKAKVQSGAQVRADYPSFIPVFKSSLALDRCLQCHVI